jgi:hypothetical protein
MAYAAGLGPVGGDTVGVRIPPPALKLKAYAGNSGGRLERGAINSIPSMNCSTFWSSIGVNDGYGETALAEDLVSS